MLGLSMYGYSIRSFSRLFVKRGNEFLHSNTHKGGFYSYRGNYSCRLTSIDRLGERKFYQDVLF